MRGGPGVRIPDFLGRRLVIVVMPRRSHGSTIRQSLSSSVRGHAGRGPITDGTGLSDQITTGIGSMTGEVIACRSCWGMTTIRSGSTPRRHRPRSAASPGDIATVGSSCSRLLHHDIRPSTAQRILDLVPIDSLVRDHHQRRADHRLPCQRSTHRAIDLLRRAIRSRTSRNPRRSRRTASGRPADECIGMTARLDVASADHWHMPFHQERIIGRRHHTHAADRQVNGQPSPPRRSRRAVMQRSRRSARSTSPIRSRATMTSCCAAYAIAIW